jgi:hypothetical protein
MNRPSRFQLAKERLQADMRNVVADLFGSKALPAPAAFRVGVVNPWRTKARKGQMSVYLRGPKAGSFIDFTTGEKGDAIDLIAFAHEGLVTADSRLRAVEWAEDRYGLKKLDPATREKMAAQAARRREIAEEEAARTQGEQRERVRKFFYACQARLAGTPIETYLAARGIRLADVPFLSNAFRFRPDCEYWPLAEKDGEGRRLAPGPSFPALVSAMVSAEGRLNACHLTFLSADGSAKAPVKALGRRRGLDPDDINEKLFKGDVRGFFIPVAHGPSGLPRAHAAEKGQAGPCGVTEGIEDALSAAIAEPRLRMDAAGSLSNLLAYPDHPANSSYLIFQDNDWGKPQAQALFQRAVRHFRSFGKPVELVAVPADWGKDVNDALQGA